MADVDLLFPLLQFVALVAPAIAILMQVFERREEQSTLAFTLLEVSLVVIFMGGFILLMRVYTAIDDFITRVGVLMVFTSILFVAIGLGWSATPVSEEFEDISLNTGNLLSGFFRWTPVLALPVFAFASIFYLSYLYLLEVFNVGPVRQVDILSVTELNLLIIIIIFIRCMMYLINIDAIPVSDLEDSMSESFAISAMMGVFYLFIVAPFLVAHILIRYNIIDQSNPILVVLYLWAGFWLIVIFALSLDEEDRT